MEEKEVKKLNEESVEKISGGTKVDGPEKVDECNQKPKELPKLSDRPFVNMEYGAPIISIKKLMDEDLKLMDEELK